MDWARILALPDRTVDQELLARNQYLAAENRRLKLSEIERGVLGEIGHGLGRWVRADVATMTRPDAILWLVPQACSAQVRWLEGASRSGQTTHQARGRGADHSHGQREPGPGYVRIAGALANLGYEISD